MSPDDRNFGEMAAVALLILIFAIGWCGG